MKIVKDLEVKTNAADLRGKTVRFGRIMLVTHVSILDGWKKTKAGRIQELVTHQDDTQWAIEKCEIGRDGKECCYTIANIIFKVVTTVLFLPILRPYTELIKKIIPGQEVEHMDIDIGDLDANVAGVLPSAAIAAACS